MSRIWDEPPDDNCGICGKAIVENVDAVYAVPDKNGRFRHWDCWEKTSTAITPKKIKEASDRFHTSLNNLRRTLAKKGLL